MTVIDWVLLAIIAMSALFGVMRGLVGVLASLAAWVLGGWAAFRFGGDVATMIAGGATPSTGQLFAGYTLSFIGVMVVVGVVGWLVKKLLHSVGLSGVDRMLGLVFGLVRGAFVACVLVLLLGFTAMPREPEWQASRLVPLAQPGALWLQGWLPEWAADDVDFGARLPGVPGMPGMGPSAEPGPLPAPMQPDREQPTRNPIDNQIDTQIDTQIEHGTELPLPVPQAAPAAEAQTQDS